MSLLYKRSKYMVFAASIVYFDENMAEDVEETIASMPNVEIYGTDIKNGKIIIVTEANDNNGIEDVEKKLRNNNAVTDVAHCAFHFGENVDGDKHPFSGEEIAQAFKRR